MYELIGFKSYDFDNDKGQRVYGYTLFFTTEFDGVEGKGCQIVKLNWNNDTKKFNIDCNANDLLIGAKYNFVYKNALDKENKTYQKLTQIIKVK